MAELIDTFTFFGFMAFVIATGVTALGVATSALSWAVLSTFALIA